MELVTVGTKDGEPDEGDGYSVRVLGALGSPAVRSLGDIDALTDTYGNGSVFVWPATLAALLRATPIPSNRPRFPETN